MSGESVLIPDDRAFSNFKEECGSEEGWSLTYNKTGMTVWTQTIAGDEEKSIHKIKCRMACKDVSSETMYDVLHDIEYRRKWDANVIETFDIGKLTVNADVGYYSWKCPKPLRNRDVITLRSWLPMGSSLPKWVVNKSSQFLAPKAMKKISKACLKYGEWKQRHNPGFKPWLYPEQTTLPTISVSELSIQHADSLENIDESTLSEMQTREERDSD
ncbi:unnamed protein product [Coregonus sp. 'balchen']|nr:unnamed protein product [Coregonus sp. 'balchen']